ncbi:DMT family transporter [Pseudodesulfovibrio sp.]|uniref:DMT family transporter n=1 Tax=Pseudodesulfovibrio sp. TaxID=2035812 RepID=UPI00260F7432|nr:DMT family transporter [Pseudodesulfovibrio sp.]MDD3312534.1 DMT family transporter [Pseudodesulfovibrio sp.]
MTPLVFSLVLASALLHIIWNSVVKASPDKASFAWLTSAGAVLFLCLIWPLGRWLEPGASLTPEVLAWAGLSGCFQTAYVILLFAAYEAVDLSVVYPVNRGGAPIMVMAAAGFLVGDTVSPMQGAGVALTALGALAVGLTNRNAAGRISLKGLALCLLTSAATAGYIITDRKVMSSMGPVRPMDYLLACTVFQTVGITLWMAARRFRFATLYEVFAAHRRSVILASIFIPLSYLLIVAALRYGNVTLISAGRNVSILLSALAGRLILHENVSPRRALGTVGIFIGLVLIAFR